MIKNDPADNSITGYANLLNGGYHIGLTYHSRDSLSTYFGTALRTGTIFRVYGCGIDSTYTWSGIVWVNTTPTAVSFAGGLTLSGTTAKLGGTFTANTLIDINSHNFAINSGPDNTSFLFNSSGYQSFSSYDANSYQGYLGMITGSFAIASTNGSFNLGLYGDDVNGLTVNDDVLSRGLVNVKHMNFGSGASPQQLTEKQYVDSLFSTGGGGATTNPLTIGYGHVSQPLSFDGSAAITDAVDSAIMVNKTFYNSVIGTATNTKIATKQATLSGTGYVKDASGAISYVPSIPIADLAANTISGVQLGNTLFAHTAGFGLTGSNYTGTGPQTWVADSTVLKSKAGFLIDYNNLTASIAGKEVPLTFSSGVNRASNIITLDQTFGATITNSSGWVFEPDNTLTTTSTPGVTLTNTNAATNNNQRVSGSFSGRSYGWGTTGSTSILTGFNIFNRPFQSTTPRGQIVFQTWDNNGGTVTDAMIVSGSTTSVPNNFTASTATIGTLNSTNLTATGITTGSISQTTANNANITMATTGITAARNIADANTAFNVNQANASSNGHIADFKAQGTTKASIDVSGNVSGLSVRGAAVVFASLPGTPVEGMMVPVTDSTTNTWGATITGGGSNHVLAYYDGTNWTVAGK